MTPTRNPFGRATPRTERTRTPRCRNPRPTHRWALIATSSTLGMMLFTAQPALADPTNSVCLIGGQPATPAQIVRLSGANVAQVRAEIIRSQSELDGATEGSPAAWRLSDQLESLRAQARDLDQLQTTAFIHGNATVASAAQFRAQEELDSLCQSLDP